MVIGLSEDKYETELAYMMPQEFSRERLADLLVDPREDLDFEVKNWLDLQGSNEDKATFAKAVLALANHVGASSS